MLVLAGSTSFLTQGLITEQYTLLTTLMLAVLLAATWMTPERQWPARWHARIRAGVVLGIGLGLAAGASGVQLHRLDDPMATGIMAWLIFVVPGCGLILLLGRLFERRCGSDTHLWLAAWLGFLWGRSCGNHLSQLVLGAIVVWALIESCRQRPDRFWRLVSMTAAGLILGLLVFVWLLMRSRLDPVMDWGNVESWDRIWWALMRRDWETRSLSELPSGFLTAWLRTFQLHQQLGWPALALAVTGLFASWWQGRRWLGWLVLAVLPYLIGIYLAHARQQGIGMDYIQQYGVGDWHLPLYLALSILSGWGMAHLLAVGLRRMTKMAWLQGAACCVLVLAFWMGTDHRQQASLRDDHAGQDFVDALLLSVPKQALVVVSESDHAFMLGYTRYAQQKRRDIWLTYADLGSYFGQGKGAGTWSPERQGRFIASLLANPEQHPLRAPSMTRTRMTQSPLIVDFPREQPASIAFLMPRGMLFEVMNQPVPQSDVRQAEREWIKDHGDDLPEPDAGQRLPVRSAWARVNLYRAEYFNMLELWPEAVNSAKSAVAWMPEHAVAWYSLGFALLQQGDHNRASEALLQSVGIDPDISGPRTALASIALNQGDKATARRLLLEELERHPDDPSAQAFWEYMQ